MPTHVNALLEFASGPSASSTFSFDSMREETSIEITGTEAVLSVPDPNTFDGALRIRGRGDREWRDLPVEGTSAGRGIGVVDMARAIRGEVPHRASGEIGQHVLEVMTEIAASAERGEFRGVGSGCRVAEPLAVRWDPREATLV